ncbi:MAG: vitamin B12 dependent methionine synthase, activation domain protein [Oscillospiraceae bacterium]|nr:vitamin B12 dependent methionine synthase, activation domain protein [Oscillospiraceae bacterium]
MNARLTGISREETLHYLSYHGGEVPSEISSALNRCETLLLRTARPRAVWRLFDRLPDGKLAGTDFMPEGSDIHSFLSDSSQVILMAATLGSETELLLQRSQRRSMADAVILDAAASAAIENVCDNLCHDLAAVFSPAFLTDRFSPGYGDFPFSQQTALCRILDVGRRIGVTLSPGGLMIPQKSVTALLGVSPNPQQKRGRGCAVCSRFDSCQYRKDGNYCGNF